MKKQSLSGSCRKYLSGGKIEDGHIDKLESNETVNHEVIQVVNNALRELDSEIDNVTAYNQGISTEISERKKEERMLEVFHGKAEKLVDHCKLFKQVMSGTGNEFVWEEEEKEFDWVNEIEKLKKELGLM